jgi:alkylhydroperoxidase family enzyme
MAWIKTIPFTQAEAALRAALDAQAKFYPKEYQRDASDDGATSIVATHTLIPDALHHAFATFGALMSPDLPLTRRQHEMITTRVSAVNRCHY